jgi:phosphoribosyl-ATP pyrophosphohydrolase/phosphoribosyl-AMP cyclohydrolase
LREYWQELCGKAKFGENGLMPAVVQDFGSGDVLMVAYMNEEALRLTAESGEAWFWSRSRGKLWNKGETSGNRMKVMRMGLDCDCDTLLLQVIPAGPACHTGAETCFVNDQSADSEDAIRRFSGQGVLNELDDVIQKRAKDPLEGSYTCKLLAAGTERVLRKVGEESGEFIIAAMKASLVGDPKSRQEAAGELADLIYHSQVALCSIGMKLKDVEDVLAARRK